MAWWQVGCHPTVCVWGGAEGGSRGEGGHGGREEGELKGQHWLRGVGEGVLNMGALLPHE
jgi:hypothetical protein